MRVFVSSVVRGLEEVRQRLLDDLRSAALDVVGMEIFGARPELPLDACLGELRRCDVAIVIIGPRYGSLRQAGDVSFTHEEFREARRRGIPVLAFVVPAEEGLDPQETSRLESFATEAGESVVFVRSSADELRTNVATTLLQQIRQGHIGPRFSFFQSYDEYYRRQLDPSALLNHLIPLIGRSETIEALVARVRSGGEHTVLVGQGGMGKSRILLEVARALDDRNVRFVSPDGEWTAEDVRELPAGALTIVFDDAHRRSDLGRLIDACWAQNEHAQFVFSARPGALDTLRYQLRDSLQGSEEGAITSLQPLGDEPALELARTTLGNDFAHLAKRLVRIADRNPLVIAIGGSCIASRQIAPELLQRQVEQFRRVVLDRLLDDPSVNDSDRRLLQLLSAIGPIAPESADAVQRVASYHGVEAHDLIAAIGRLEQHGFLMRRGRLVRVMPDVLADHLLYRASLTEDGQPTGFVDSVLDQLSPEYTGNILANASELDWRSSVTESHAAVLGQAWVQLRRGLPQLGVSERICLVENLQRAAIYAPDEVLQIVEVMAAPFVDGAAEVLASVSAESVLYQKVCDRLRFIATHPTYTTRCVQTLWRLAKIDERETNRFPEHPRQLLSDLVRYDRQRPVEVQETATQTLVDRIEATIEDEPVPWAIVALSPVLVRTGESHVATRRGLTLQAFPISAILPRVEPLRELVFDLCTRCAVSTHLEEAACSVSQLGKLLRGPERLFGREIPAEETAAWLPESRAAVAVLVRIATEAPLDVIKYLGHRELRSFDPQYWPDTGPV